jgi:hypothetical protein
MSAVLPSGKSVVCMEQGGWVLIIARLDRHGGEGAPKGSSGNPIFDADMADNRFSDWIVPNHRCGL